MRATLVLSLLSLVVVSGCQSRDTIMVVPDRQGHARMSIDSAPATGKTRVPRTGEQIHTVAAGDTLSSIGKKYNVELSWLIERNDIVDAQKPLKVGQQIIVPKR